MAAATPGPDRDRLIDAARALFGSDPTDDVADLAVSVRLAPGERRVQLPTARRRMVAAAAVGLVLCTGCSRSARRG